MRKNELVCDCNSIHADNIALAKSKMLDSGTLAKITNFYKALADSTRTKIINLLEKNELCVCDICVILNMTKSAVSHQLKYLKQMNIIKSERRGKEIWYTLADNHVSAVFDISLEHILEEHNEKNQI